MSLVVVDRGLATTVQDLGRPGLAHLGVPPSGAVDPELATMLNRLVGNPPGAAVIETVGGLRLRAIHGALIAHDGASAPHRVDAGEEVVVPAGGDRRWHYLAVRGGIATPRVLGSRSHDTLSGIAGLELTVGAVIEVGTRAAPVVPVDAAPVPPPRSVARVRPGPRIDWFDDEALDTLTAAAWRITEVSRVGVRLAGPTIVRRRHDELPSEGLVRGAIQVPADGQPVMMLADHPTTGGYPVLAVVDAADVAAVAQSSAATPVRFRR